MNDNEYLLIKFDNKEYYVNAKQLVKNVKDVVLEKERYVRTSVTVYENETDSKIASFIKKGNKLDITGYDKLLDDGNVNMYKIKYNDTEGYVYSKYLVNDKESADSVYNENGVYDIHKDRKFKGRELYGGKASTLDYYPYERVEFEDNKLLKKAKTMYLNAGTIGSIDSYLKIAKENGVNAIVVELRMELLLILLMLLRKYLLLHMRPLLTIIVVISRLLIKLKMLVFMLLVELLYLMMFIMVKIILMIVLVLRLQVDYGHRLIVEVLGIIMLN